MLNLIQIPKRSHVQRNISEKHSCLLVKNWCSFNHL